MTSHGVFSPNDLAPSPENGAGFGGLFDKMGTFLNDNLGWIALAVFLFLVLLVLVWALKDRQDKKRLQRDALLRYAVEAAETCKLNRQRGIRSLHTTGNGVERPRRLGKYRGHADRLDVMVASFGGGFFRKPRVFHFNRCDLASTLEGPQLLVRAVSVDLYNGILVATPDVHDARQRADWAPSLGRRIDDPAEFAEAVKAFYWRAVDNAIARMAAHSMSEDQEFMVREATRGRDERTDTVEVARTTKPAPAAALAAPDTGQPGQGGSP